MVKKWLGVVKHYFPRIGVAVVKLKAKVSVGDKVSFEGFETDLHQKVESMQVDGRPVESAKSGEVAIKVKRPVNLEDHVYAE